MGRWIILLPVIWWLYLEAITIVKAVAGHSVATSNPKFQYQEGQPISNSIILNCLYIIAITIADYLIQMFPNSEFYYLSSDFCSPSSVL